LRDSTAPIVYGVNSHIVKPAPFAAFAEAVMHIKAYWPTTELSPFLGPARRPSRAQASEPSAPWQ
jgi:hypothetical protein